MARRSLLTPALDQSAQVEPASVPVPQPAESRARVAPSRQSKLHVGGYYDPRDPIVVAFQKLGIDLRRTQQDMLMEAIRDFVAKHEAANAFK
jgi:hypothetical protein